MAGKTYQIAPKALKQRVANALQTWHSRLFVPLMPHGSEETPADSEARYHPIIETILAHGPRDRYGCVSGDAITVHGRKAMACIRVTKLEERVAGRGDAIIWVDGDEYKEWLVPTLDAILDHELTHLETVLDKYGNPAFDDLNRLKLRLRPHDFQVGWFDEVAERHGHVSVEAMQAAELVAKQMYFPGFEVIKSRRSA